MKILSLDISSATIGWATLSKDKEIISLDNYGHIKPISKKKSKDNLSLRLSDTMSQIDLLIKAEAPDLVIIEDYAKKFSIGRSSANTIILLAVFNESVALAAYNKLGTQAVRHTVSKLRAFVNKRHSVKIKDKLDVINLVKKVFPTFKIALNRNNNIKKEAEDEADAILLGYYHLLSIDI